MALGEIVAEVAGTYLVVPVHTDNWDESFGGFFCRQDITRLMELLESNIAFTLFPLGLTSQTGALGCLTKHTPCKPGLYVWGFWI